MIKTCLKNGQEVIIRLPQKEDAQQMIDFYNVVGGETNFLSFGKNEFSMSLNEYEKFLEVTKKVDNSIVVVATVNDEIISIASITSGQKARTKHVGTFGIVVSKKYCGLGLGVKLMDYLMDWSKSNGVTKKISLVTNEENTVAIELYKKFGFEVDCILKKDNYVNGEYLNTVIMSILF
ncbi:GNAT family N-acetyltransferase [Clostridium frigidicarnis]|uniref:Protein N-acetyltransferase, RimJ/RimL family n=1 Tax=Clostridium frigidicarnis TaxID=84698 RepID=A0A1I0X5G3_9CLOT|nr:GNAT family N-acetyltransferase [Clostridium frigidicarnis]SFA95283.1 Protein N-acetyltransferase, RimJ/RimL family [Clostridium frigidicarnis]